MSQAPDSRIPTHLWVEAEVRRLSDSGIGVYVLARGDRAGGMVLQKINNLSGQCRLLGQERDLSGRLVWINALQNDLVLESEADGYIRRAIERDPDLWVVEIEDRSMQSVLGEAIF